jgi:hypothetical protein
VPPEAIQPRPDPGPATHRRESVTGGTGEESHGGPAFAGWFTARSQSEAGQPRRAAPLSHGMRASHAIAE